MLVQFNELQGFIGLNDPLKKIYVTGDPISLLPFVLYFMVHFEINYLRYDKKLDTLIQAVPRHKDSKSKGGPQIQSSFLCYGIACLLNQYHKSNRQVFIGLIVQYIRSQINFGLVGSKGSKDKSKMKECMQMANEICLYNQFLEEFYSSRGEST